MIILNNDVAARFIVPFSIVAKFGICPVEYIRTAWNKAM